MPHSALSKEQVGSNAQQPGRLWRRALPWLLAAFFATLGLREIGDRDLYSDAPNHLLNGALVADWIRSGNLAHPIDFATNYYASLPAITIPFHPPMFPAIEGLFFLVFGANVVVARLVIASAVALSVVLLCRLAQTAAGSGAAAVCAAAVFFSMRSSTYLASNVMLEMPTLVFVLAALYQLRNLDGSFSLNRAVAFGLLAAAAVWTKQQAVFLGLVPFAYIAISRSWRLLLKKEVWVSAVLFAAAVFAFMRLTSQFSGSGGASEIPDQDYIARTLQPRAMFYLASLSGTLGGIGSIWIGLSCLYALWQPRAERRNKGLDIHLAWASCAFAVLFLTGHLDRRYLFFAYAPLIVLGLVTLERLCEQFVSVRWAWVAPAAIAAASVAAIAWQPRTPYVRGSAEAADHIVDGTPHRVLYCGSVGVPSFIFSVRSLDPQLGTSVIRASSVAAKLSVREIEELAHRYAIDSIVVTEPRPDRVCDALKAGVPSTMVLKAEVPITSSEPSLAGTFKIYRFTDPSQTPEKRLKIRLPRLRRDVFLHLQ